MRVDSGESSGNDSGLGKEKWKNAVKYFSEDCTQLLSIL
jgi:hypothetical protein